MSLLDEIEAIEIPTVINFRWFYHAFNFNKEDFSDMISSGLKCAKLLNITEETGGYNGPYYISLSRYFKNARNGKSSYLTFSGLPRFIIDKVGAIKCSCSFKINDLSETILPFRHSVYNDEYQAFWRIKPNKFVGIQYSILEAVDDNNIDDLINLRDMILLMKKYNVNLPVYDYSQIEDDKVNLVIKEKYLTLCKEYHIGNEKK